MMWPGPVTGLVCSIRLTIMELFLNGPMEPLGKAGQARDLQK
jgi:hypothetical protein